MIISEIITNEQIDQLTSLSENERWNEYKKYDFNIDLWYSFWTQIYEGETTDNVLDYGCGATWGSFVGRYLGYNNHCNLDIDMEDVKRIFTPYNKILNSCVEYWDGVSMSYGNDTFDSIVSKAALSKNVNSDWESVLSELSRITKPFGVWYIAPPYMVERIPKSLYEKFVSTKNIEIISWDWDRKDSRNYTEGSIPSYNM